MEPNGTDDEFFQEFGFDDNVKYKRMMEGK